MVEEGNSDPFYEWWFTFKTKLWWWVQGSLCQCSPKDIFFLGGGTFLLLLWKCSYMLYWFLVTIMDYLRWADLKTDLFCSQFQDGEVRGPSMGLLVPSKVICALSHHGRHQEREQGSHSRTGGRETAEARFNLLAQFSLDHQPVARRYTWISFKVIPPVTMDPLKDLSQHHQSEDHISKAWTPRKQAQPWPISNLYRLV